jgi:hypothetical protein
MVPHKSDEDSPLYLNIHLTSDTLLLLRQRRYIKRLPQMTKDEINDHSKSDLFTKLVTAVQVFSIIVQVILRRTRNLTISPLELAVTAFSVCATLTYLLVLYQPNGVQTTTVLENDGELPLSFDEAYRYCLNDRYVGVFLKQRGQSFYLRGEPDEGVPNVSVLDNTGEAVVVGSFSGGTIFGGIHCCGWTFPFPTFAEQLLWKIASAGTTIAPGFVAGLFIISNFLDNKITSAFEMLAAWTIIICYVIARLFLVVEIFRSLFYLPPDAFISTWADSIPRIS